MGTQLGALLRDLDVPVVISDTNHRNLRSARDLGVPAFYDDVLSEAAEHMLEMHRYNYAIALSENEAYNTLVTTDLAPEFGRNNIFQLRRVREYSRRHELPSTLGVRPFLGDETYSSSLDKILLDWRMGVTRISTEYSLERDQCRWDAHFAFLSTLNRRSLQAGRTKRHNPALTLGHGVINRPQDKG